MTEERKEQRERPRINRLRALAAYFGLMCSIAGGLMLAPLACLLVWPEERAFLQAFLYPALGLLAAGLLLWLICKPKAHPPLTLRDGGAIVVTSWAVCCLCGAVPFMAAMGLPFTHAFFESVSGYTTTGLSVITVESAPRSILLWRSVMQLAGGAGLAVIMLAAITGPPGTGLSGAEGRSDQLAPNVRKSAVLVLCIYSLYAVFGCTALRLAGMSWFDALNHAFTAISTGGFSTRTDSIGHFRSAQVEGVAIALMFLGGLNFITAHLFFTGKWRHVLKNSELRLAALLFCLTVTTFLILPPEAFPPSGRLRTALFEGMSALTTTGFSSTAYANWSPLGALVLITLMVIGGGAGSTAGGIKQLRALLMLRNVVWEVRRILLPKNAVFSPSVYMGKQPLFIEDAEIRRTGAFLTMYLAGLALGTTVLTAHGYPLRDSLFEFASALGTVGLSLGITSPQAPPLVLWAEICGMFLGRLEFFIVFVSAAYLFRLARKPVSPQQRPLP